MAVGITGGTNKPSEVLGGGLLFKMNGSSYDMAGSPLLNNSGGSTNIPQQTFSVNNYRVERFNYYGLGLQAKKPISKKFSFVTGFNVFTENYKVENVILTYSLQNGNYLNSSRRTDSSAFNKRYNHLGIQLPVGVLYQPFKIVGIQLSFVNNYMFGPQNIIDSKDVQLTGYRGMLRLSANILSDKQQKLILNPFYEMGVKQLPDNKRWNGWGLGAYYRLGK